MGAILLVLFACLHLQFSGHSPIPQGSCPLLSIQNHKLSSIFLSHRTLLVSLIAFCSIFNYVFICTMSSFTRLYVMSVQGREMFCSLLFTQHEVGIQYTSSSIHIYLWLNECVAHFKISAYVPGRRTSIMHSLVKCEVKAIMIIIPIRHSV